MLAFPPGRQPPSSEVAQPNDAVRDLFRRARSHQSQDPPQQIPELELLADDESCEGVTAGHGLRSQRDEVPDVERQDPRKRSDQRQGWPVARDLPH